MSRGSVIKGITIEIDGNTTKLQNALSGVNSTIYKCQDGLRDVNKLLKLDPGNVTLLQQKQQYLGEEIEATRQKIQTERAALEQLKTAGDTTKTQEQQRALEREITELTSRLKTLEKQARQTASVLGSQMQAAGQKIQGVGQSISQTGKNLTTHVTLPILALGAAAVSTTADFDTAMSKVQAISGATGENFDALREKARALGSETKYSASEAAEAMVELSLAGWDTEQILGGIDGVLDLAASSGLELAQAAGIISGNLAAFNMEASESGRLADMLATAQAESKTTAEQMGEAWDNSATTLTRAGQSAETTTALLEGMASVNDTGSAAGTKLNAVMSQMTQKMTDGAIAIGDTTVQVMDAEGNYRDLIDILADVEAATDGLGDAERAASLQTTFNRTSMQGMNELLAVGSDRLRKYRTSLLNSSGAAEEMAEVMQDNLAGQLTVLKSQTQELAISFGDLLVPKAQEVVGVAQDIVTGISGLSAGAKETIINAGLVAAAAGPVLLVGGKLITGTGKLITGTGKLIPAVKNLTGQLITGIGKVEEKTGNLIDKIAASGYSSLVGAFASAAAATFAFVYITKQIADAQNEANAAFQRGSDGLFGIELRYHEAKAAMSETMTAISGEEQNIIALIAQLEQLTASTEQDAASQAKIKAIVEELNQQVPELGLSYDELTGSLNMTTDAVLRLAQAEINKQKIETLNENLITTLEEQAKAEERLAEAKAEVTEAQSAYNEAFWAYQEALLDPDTGHQDLLDLKDELTAASEDLAYARKCANDCRDAYDEMGDHAEELAGEISELSGGMEDSGDAAGDAADAMSDLGDEAEDLTEEAEAAAEAFETLVEDLLEMPDLVAATGLELEELAGLLQESGVSAEQFASSVASARDGVINSFKSIADEGAITAAEMGEVLAENLRITQEWTANLGSLWRQAYANQDTAVMEYINYLADQGPAYAAAIAEFANGGYAQLESQAATFQAIGQLSAQNTAAGMWMDAYLAAEAGAAVGSEAASGAQSVEGFGDVGAGYDSEIAGGMASGSEDVSGEAEGVVEDAQTAAKGVSGWSGLGYNIDAGIAAGVKSGSGLVAAAVRSVVRNSLIAGQAEAQVKSPSRLFRDKLGYYIPEGVAVGISAKSELVSDAIRDMVQEGAEAVTGRQLAGMGSAIAGLSGSFRAMGNPLSGGQVTVTVPASVSGNDASLQNALEVLETYLPKIANMQVVLEDGTLVGRLTPGIDRALSQRQAVYARGGVR